VLFFFTNFKKGPFLIRKINITVAIDLPIVQLKLVMSGFIAVQVYTKA